MAPPERMLRIGMVSPYSLTIPGGVQAQVLGLARVMRSMGHECRALGPCDGPPPEPWVTPLGNSIPTAANGSIAPLAPDPSAALRTIRSLRDEDFDVVHLHEPFAPGPTQTAVVMHTAPIVATFHRAGASTAYRAMDPLIRRYAGRIAVRCAVSKDAYELASQWVKGEYIMLFNGVEIDRYRTTAPAPRGPGPTIFFCGRHEERKGLDVLLQALVGLGSNVTCWVASTGPDTVRLKATYAGDPRIVWLGRLSDAEKVAHLAAADAFCAPSLHGESFGVVLLEAMAAGTPVVASALDGYQNVATADVDALLVPPGDVEALSSALRLVITDRRVAQRLRDAGRQRAEEFSMHRLAECYLEIYRSVLGSVKRVGGDGGWRSTWDAVTGRMITGRRRQPR
jgi:phosphatidylinositol alpha-mannosyltransferase